MRFLAILLLICSPFAYAGQGGEYVRAYLEEWLKAHDYKDYSISESGIKFNSVDLTLNGEIYGINELAEGEIYSVETQLTATLENGRNLEDFVAGSGATPKEAFLDSLNNFCLTTLHPIYAGLVDKNDDHVRKEKWNLSSKSRNVYLSDWGQRGEPIEKQDQDNIEKLISTQLSKLNISDDVHWVKLVVSSVNGKMGTVVLTIDGVQYDEIDKALKAYHWPISKKFYLVKLFFVIGKA